MNKTAKIIIATLLISNLALIGFHYLGKSKKRHGNSPMKVIIEKLDFDKTQKKEFKNLIDVHRNELQKAHENITRKKNILYKSLREESPTMNDSLRNEISLEILKIEDLHFNHFNDIKNLCNETQKEQFNAMVDELSIIFQPKRRPKKH